MTDTKFLKDQLLILKTEITNLQKRRLETIANIQHQIDYRYDLMASIEKQLRKDK